MNRVLLLGGNNAGRIVAAFLRQGGIQVYVDEKKDSNDISDIKHFLRKNEIDRVIDVRALDCLDCIEQLQAICRDMKAKYHRVTGECEETQTTITYIDTILGAVELLSETQGNILIATGSKGLASYTKLHNYKERCYARVLSTKESMAESTKLGFEGAHLIAMQGPFSTLSNEAHLLQIKASYFVVKSTGAGYKEKVQAAKKTGVKLIVIGEKTEAKGQSVQELCLELSKVYGIDRRKKVYLVGVGTGDSAYMTGRAKEILKSADIVLGSKRMEIYAQESSLLFYQAYQPKEVNEFLKNHQEYNTIAVALSGDASFYSGAKRLKKVLKEYEVEVIPGISSISYFAACMQAELEDAAVLSLHGRSCNVIGALHNYGKVFLLMESAKGIKLLCEELIYYGYEHVFIGVGSRLSYEDETIITGYPKDCMEHKYDDLSVVYIADSRWKEPVISYGLADDAFVQGISQMTAGNIRSMALSKLMLNRDSIVYDIASANGSVAVEIALQVTEGMVYAMDKENANIPIIRENQKLFKTTNVTVSEGEASQVIDELPMATHAFIGQGCNNAEVILEILLKRNKHMRVVISTASFETVYKCTEYLKKMDLSDNIQLTYVTVSNTNINKNEQQMIVERPVYLIALGGKK